MARRTKSEDPGLSLVESTGNVEFDATPVTLEQPAENQSTGNVEYEAPGTTEVSHYTEDVIVRAETPGPVTFTVAGLPGVQYEAPEAPTETPDTTAEAAGTEPVVTEESTADTKTPDAGTVETKVITAPETTPAADTTTAEVK